MTTKTLMMSNILKETYLGDGVYASYDMFGRFILDLRGQDQSTRIYLETEVIEALHRFEESVKGLRDGD